nr:unnamed protein product [Spirometra erinaceieuropaei]
MFADDMKIWIVIRGPADEDRLQMNLNRLEEWSNRWLLRFNVAKCSILRLGNTARSASTRNYFLGGVALQEVEAQKDLGVLTTSSLKPSTHCSRVAKSAMSVVYAIKLTVSMSVDRTPEVFMSQHDAKDTISCCYSSDILEKLFQVKSQPWRFLLQNINWSKLRILDDFLHPNLPVYEELSSLIVESGDSHSPICNVSFVTDNNTLSVHFDFRSRLSTLKCTLQIDQYKTARVSINAVDVHEKSAVFLRVCLCDPVRTESCDPREDLGTTDYTAFCMPIHLAVKSGERSFISIAVLSDKPPTGDSYRVTLMLRRFRSVRIASRDFDLNRLAEIHDYVTKYLKISHTNTNFS